MAKIRRPTSSSSRSKPAAGAARSKSKPTRSAGKTTKPKGPSRAPAKSAAKRAPVALQTPASPRAARPLPPPDGSRILTLTPKEFLAQVRADMKAAQAEIDRLKSMPTPRDTRAALAAYDAAAALLGGADARSGLCQSVHPDKAMRDAAEVAERELAQLATDLSLDRGVYDALASLDLKGQDDPTQYWVRRTLDSFRRNGVSLDPAAREKVKALKAELVEVGQDFSRNILEDVRKVQCRPEDLEGLPADFLAAHPPGPDGKITITTDRSDFDPVMKYAAKATTREALWRAYNARAYPQNDPVLLRLLDKRHQLATLLGYRNHAHLATEDKMIGDEKRVGEFIGRVAGSVQERAKNDYAELLARKKADQPSATQVLPWDVGYLSTKIQAERYGADAQAARPYFEYKQVKDGLLNLCGKLFGLSFRPANKAKVWHRDVEAYDVLDETGSRVLGRIYLDMHPRDGKYKHFAQFTVVNGQADRRLPEGALVCNFAKPGDAPALLEHSNVVTFFHEFGHLLHHVLGGHTAWNDQSGVATEWDFVEAPSQFFEEWAWDPEVLQLFARHHQTREPIPADMVKRMKAADEFGKGVQVARQMAYAATSLHFHDHDTTGMNPTEAMAEIKERFTPFQRVDGDHAHAAFGHLNGYSSNYYTYMWSLVIAKDLATAFTGKGLMDRQTAVRYRQHILEPGGTKPASELVQGFLGRPYNYQAFERWLKA